MQYTFILPSVHNTHTVVINSSHWTAARRTSLIHPPHVAYQNNPPFFTPIMHNSCPLAFLQPLFWSLSLCYRQIFGAIILAKFSSSSWVLLMRRPIRQMLSVSANQLPRLAIKSAQVASVRNELLATTECEESCSFPPLLPKISLSRWNLTPVGLSGR